LLSLPKAWLQKPSSHSATEPIPVFGYSVLPINEMSFDSQWPSELAASASSFANGDIKYVANPFM
jgi:hypothetical protein